MEDRIWEKMEDLEFAKSSFALKVVRAENHQGEAQIMKVPPGSELEEVKQKAFELVYPGNGKAPWQTKLLSVDGMEVDDVTILEVLPDGKLLVDPGLGFVDQTAVRTIMEKQEAERKQQREKEKEKEKENRKIKMKSRFSSVGRMFGGKNREKMVQRSFTVKAEAVKPYAAEREDELDFEKGDSFMIDVSSQAEEGWVYAQIRGKVGIIPVTHIRINREAGIPEPILGSISTEAVGSEATFTDESAEQVRNLIQATCLHNFEGATEEELSVTKGDVVMVDVEQLSKGEEWLYTELNGKVGYIPINYVKVGIIDPDKELQRKRSWIFAEVLYAYEAQKEDEFSLRAGDFIMVDEIQDDPSWRVAQIGGREGFIPDEYVRSVTKEEVKRRAKMKLAEIRSQKRLLEEDIRKKKIKDAHAARLKKIRDAELAARRREAEEKRLKEQAESQKAEMVKRALWTRKNLLSTESDEEQEDY